MILVYSLTVALIVGNGIPYQFSPNFVGSNTKWLLLSVVVSQFQFFEKIYMNLLWGQNLKITAISKIYYTYSNKGDTPFSNFVWIYDTWSSL